MRRVLAVVALLSMPVWQAATAGTATLDTAKIEALTGAKGTLDDKEGAFKVSVPRTDLRVSVGGVRLTSAMGLTSWAAFKPVGAHAMVMGDLVLLEDQVNPVMSTALDNGLQVTALHNHFFWDTPKVMFMHIAGMADQEALATAGVPRPAQSSGSTVSRGTQPRRPSPRRTWSHSSRCSVTSRRVPGAAAKCSVPVADGSKRTVAPSGAVTTALARSSVVASRSPKLAAITR